METRAPDRPEILHAEWPDITGALRAGLRDFGVAPVFGLFFACFYVVGGWMVTWAVMARGQLWWTLPASAGFPILGPFIACGLYEVSRRIETGERLAHREVLGVIFRQKDRQIPSMAAVVVIFFLFWNFLAHMIFALFMGQATLTNITSSVQAFLTPEGLTMLAFGSAVGAVFASLLFAITVVSLPMLLDREVDFVTAMITSFGVVKESPVVMLGWGAVIAVALFVGMLPGFFGLFFVLPVLGHASWHVYRSTVAWEGEGDPEAEAAVVA
jgi:uncharacterized membrane protein